MSLRLTESQLHELQQRRTAKALPKAEWMPITRDEKELLEKEIQGAIIEWADNETNQQLFDGLETLYAVPNAGKRSKRQGFLEKCLGLRAGVPDLCLPIKRKGYGSLFIELKTYKRYSGKNQGLSESQLEWIKRLTKHGNKVCVCWSVREVIQIIKDYLK